MFGADNLHSNMCDALLQKHMIQKRLFDLNTVSTGMENDIFIPFCHMRLVHVTV